tara:strand:- start:521 stop:1321 length:801 start_codon:yes stop_codon:yes gene_type:complete
MEKFTTHKIGFNEYITGNKFIDICEETGATFCKTDYISLYRQDAKKVFVTHNSDYGITRQICDSCPSHHFWLAQNKECQRENVIPIPIGLENMFLRTCTAAAGGKFSSQVPGALQKAETIDRLANLQLSKDNLVYMNFNIKTYPKERQRVWDMFVGKTWVTNTSNLSMDHFYFDLARHKFVFSPRGNGLDCHRTWEALYLRTIPIVLRVEGMRYFEDLPIYFVDDWSEITEESLNKFYQKMLNSEYNLGKMKISWWKDKINRIMEE